MLIPNLDRFSERKRSAIEGTAHDDAFHAILFQLLQAADISLSILHYL